MKIYKTWRYVHASGIDYLVRVSMVYSPYFNDLTIRNSYIPTNSRSTTSIKNKTIFNNYVETHIQITPARPDLETA
jgi:hypothetical protein